MRGPSVCRTGLVLATAAVLFTAARADAFYWVGWPGSNVTPQPTLLTPSSSVTPGSTPPPASTPITPPGLQEFTPEPVGPPEHVPEPATGVAGLIGIGALAWRWVRRKRGK